ncbi:Gfo/Idh/MocA family oxidoreductase [bacterium]|nr:Gfo/Idh/MocA family oxidoreductase [bacterium]
MFSNEAIMYQALIIGCGNIGAMYDFDSKSVLTYAKAFHLDPEIEFEVYDIDPIASQKIAAKYDVQSIRELTPDTFKNYDIVVICTPTGTHHEYLSAMLGQGGVQLVICEKPVDSSRKRLNLLLELYAQSETKVMVNFFRRFQPGTLRLKARIESIQQEERCTNIVITYQRGFHNNASHAIDLLEFLFSSLIDFNEMIINYCAFDEFDIDPTISLSGNWNGTNLQFVGLAQVEFSHFEIAIYFPKRALLLKDGANIIEEYSVQPKSGNYYPKLSLLDRQTGMLDDYMTNGASHAKVLLKVKESRDNFQESVHISERILKLLGC